MAGSHLFSVVDMVLVTLKAIARFNTHWSDQPIQLQHGGPVAVLLAGRDHTRRRVAHALDAALAGRYCLAMPNPIRPGP